MGPNGEHEHEDGERILSVEPAVGVSSGEVLDASAVPDTGDVYDDDEQDETATGGGFPDAAIAQTGD